MTEIYTVSVQDLQALGVHEKTAYRDLKDGVNRLYERSISLDIDDKLIKMRWVQRIEFTENQSIVALRFSKDILPFIYQCKRLISPNICYLKYQNAGRIFCTSL